MNLASTDTMVIDLMEAERNRTVLLGIAAAGLIVIIGYVAAQNRWLKTPVSYTHLDVYKRQS